MTTGVLFMAIGIAGIIVCSVILAVLLHTTSRKIRQQRDRVMRDYK